MRNSFNFAWNQMAFMAIFKARNNGSKRKLCRIDSNIYDIISLDINNNAYAKKPVTSTST